MSISDHLIASMKKHSAKHKKTTPKSSKPARMEIEKAEGEGYVIKHHMEDKGGMYKAPEVHVAKNHKDMMKHVKEHMGPDDDGDKDSEA